MSIVTDKKSLVGLALTLLLHVVASLADPDNPHLVQKSRLENECTSCHIQKPQLKDDGLLNTKNHRLELKEFNQDGVAMCSACHRPHQEHKMIRLPIDFPVPADMPLGENNGITCLTCHYTHGSLSSEQPQANCSFMDRLLNSERLHKSFLLRRNNSSGELCLICHNPS